MIYTARPGSTAEVERLAWAGAAPESCDENLRIIRELRRQLGKRLSPLTRETFPNEYAYWAGMVPALQAQEASKPLPPYSEIGVVYDRGRSGHMTPRVTDYALLSYLGEAYVPKSSHHGLGRAVLRIISYATERPVNVLNLSYTFERSGVVALGGVVLRAGNEAVYAHVTDTWEQLGLDLVARLPAFDENRDTHIPVHPIRPPQLRDLSSYMLATV